MERINLSKREKHVLRTLQKGNSDLLSHFDSEALKELEKKGFVKVAWAEGYTFEDVRLRTTGKEYLYTNPHLFNPINWAKIAAIAGIISALTALAALFIACSRFW